MNRIGVGGATKSKGELFFVSVLDLTIGFVSELAYLNSFGVIRVP